MGDIDTTGNHSLPTAEIVAPLASTSQVQPSTQAELPATASEKQTAESQEQQPPSETHSVLPKSRAETPVTDVVIDLSSSAAKYQTTSTSENEETDESKPHVDKKARRIRKRRKQKGKERDEERGTTDEEGEIPDNLDSSENAGKGSWGEQVKEVFFLNLIFDSVYILRAATTTLTKTKKPCLLFPSLHNLLLQLLYL